MAQVLGSDEDYTSGCWILLMALNRLGKIVTKTKLHKLIFLVHEEAQIKGGYEDFRKHFYGPHSFHLTADSDLLAQKNILYKESVIGYTEREYSIYHITEKGKQLFEENYCPNSDPEVMKRAEKVLDKYGECGYKELTEFVYKKYLPKPDEYDERRDRVLDDLKIIESLWEEEYSPESVVYVNLMSAVEYINLIFSKIKDTSLDPVVRGVLLVTSEDLIETIFEINEKYFEGQNPEENLKILEDLFGFICYYAQKTDVLPDLDNFDFSEFLSEEEIERLQHTPTEELQLNS